MYTFLIVLILIASVLMVLAVLVQNPKSGMASNFTWGAAAVVLLLSIASTAFIGKKPALNDGFVNASGQIENTDNSESAKQ